MYKIENEAGEVSTTLDEALNEECIREPLNNSILRFVNATSMSHVSWMNSLSPARIASYWPIAALASTCNRITHKHISIALEDSESQSVSPGLVQRFPGQFEVTVNTAFNMLLKLLLAIKKAMIAHRLLNILLQPPRLIFIS